MNTDKLVEAIQILVEQEVKKQIPIIRKQILESISKTESRKKLKSNRPTLNDILSEEIDLSSEEVQYVKDPVLNKVLNETKRNTSSYPGSTPDQFESYPTMKPNPVMMGSMAEKLGYGDFGSSSKQGLGVKTGNDALDKALNRDYTELVKRFK